MTGTDGSDDRDAASARAARLPPGLRQLAALLADGLGEFANATLGLDVASAARLAELEGVRVLILARPPAGMPGPDEIPFALQVSAGRLRFVAGAVEHPHAIVAGTLPDLIGWVASRGKASPSGLRIDGDTLLLETLSAMAREYRPDLETPLGRLVGSANAVRLLDAAEVAIAGVRTALQTAASGVREGAAQRFATADGLRQFLDELDELTLAVDRLEAHVSGAEAMSNRP